MTSAYPLQWPEGWKRTPAGQRKNYGAFKTTFDKARRELDAELKRLGAKNVVVSSYVPLRNDGNPRADMARRSYPDPGVAVYFTLRGKQMVLARDVYWTVHDNLRSIGLAIEHLRGLERHGGATMMERAFEGFSALPEPGNAAHRAPWWKVLGFEALPAREFETMAKARAQYREKAKFAHPDNGGSHDQMADLNAAIDAARVYCETGA